MTMRPLAPRRRFARDEDASASIEFILTFPLLFLLLSGSYVWFDAFRTNSLVGKTAYTTADIASRWANTEDEPHVLHSELEEIFEAHKTLLPPRVQDGWLRVSSICFNGTSNRVLWSYVGDDTYEEAMLDPLDAKEPRIEPLVDADIPASVIPPMSDDDSVLLVEVFAAWEPLFTSAGFLPHDWRNRIVVRPRFVPIIPVEAADAAAKFLPDYPYANNNVCPEDP